MAQAHFDGAQDLAGAFPMQVLPDAVGLPQAGRENQLAYANLNFNAMGPKNALYERALAAVGDAPAWVLQQCKRERSPRPMATRLSSARRRPWPRRRTP